MTSSVIVGTGSFVPENKIPNSGFLTSEFYEKGVKVSKDVGGIIAKFESITGIGERRYADTHHVASDLGFFAAEDAIQSAGVDREKIDYIIVAHNFGDVRHGSNRVDIVPSLGSRIKSKLKITNPECIAYDLPFGCPGWVEGIIQANYYIRSGEAKRCLVIGCETLSRVIDPHDKDSMIFSDGAGAVILEASHGHKGIVSHKTETHAFNHCDLLTMERSLTAINGSSNNLYLKMNGRRVYEFALTHVPVLVKKAIDKANLHITDINKILIHQANAKMDHAIGERLFQLYGLDTFSQELMPMTIGHLGNSSVATVPTMLDLILKGKLADHSIGAGDNVVFASVGAGMNINAVVYSF